jgi:hypothetical protein
MQLKHALRDIHSNHVWLHFGSSGYLSKILSFTWPHICPRPPSRHRGSQVGGVHTISSRSASTALLGAKSPEITRSAFRSISSRPDPRHDREHPSMIVNTAPQGAPKCSRSRGTPFTLLWNPCSPSRGNGVHARVEYAPRAVDAADCDAHAECDRVTRTHHTTQISRDVPASGGMKLRDCDRNAPCPATDVACIFRQ